MQKRILYIGYNFSPELTGIGKYSGEMMEWLAKKGHRCTVITAFPYYPQWKVEETYRKKSSWFQKEEYTYEGGGRMTIFRCPMYVPKRPTGKKRIGADFSFFSTSFLRILALLLKQKDAYVISVAPTFLSGVLGALYRKVTGAKHLHHIQDLQIETAQELGMIKSKSLIKALFKVEKFIFRNSDTISSISEAMIKRIGEKAKRKIAFLPNWTDTDFFYPITDTLGLKQKFGFSPIDKIVLYSGGIGEKQGLENILAAAKALEDEQALKFVICGSGPYKMVLEEMAKSMALKNVFFLPLQPKDDFNAFLNMADIHLVIQKKNAGDLVMPSKLTTILAVGGVALVTAEPGTDLYELVNRYTMGLTIEPEDEEALTQGILTLCQSEEIPRIQKNAHDYAKKYLAIDQIMQHLDNELLSSPY